MFKCGVPLSFSVHHPEVLSETSTIDMKYDTDMHVLLRMNCNNFGDPLSFHLLLIIIIINNNA